MSLFSVLEPVLEIGTIEIASPKAGCLRDSAESRRVFWTFAVRFETNEEHPDEISM